MSIITNLNGLNGSVVQKLYANNMNMSVLRTNAILQDREWMDLDKNVIKVAEERLVITQDLINAGLTYDLGGIGTTISQWQVESDMTDAIVSMEPDTEGNRDLVDYQIDKVPVPIIHKDFSIGLRQLDASRRMGSNIDLTNSDAAARRVAVGMEDLVVKGYASKFAGQSIYGVTTHPNRITGTAPGPWTTIENIYETVLNMLEAADAAHRYGPFNLYIPSGLGMLLYRFYDDGSGQTVEQRLQQITPIQAVRVSDRLANNEVVLVQMTSDTIDLAVAQPLIPVEWDTKGGMVTNYKILTSMAPRIKPDANGKLGIVHFALV